MDVGASFAMAGVHHTVEGMVGEQLWAWLLETGLCVQLSVDQDRSKRLRGALLACSFPHLRMSLLPSNPPSQPLADKLKGMGTWVLFPWSLVAAVAPSSTVPHSILLESFFNLALL